jgi:hypothetical protein
MSIKTDLKTVRQFMGLFTDYRKAKAIESLDNIQKELKDSEKKYDESMRMLETYIRKLHESQEENKRLRAALLTISNSSCPMRENEYGYTSESPECHEIAEKALEGKP